MNIKRIIFSMIAGMLGSMGFGGGTVLIIYLTAVENFTQTKAQGINLIFFIPYAVFSIIIYIRKGLIEKRELPSLIIPAVIGAALGYMLIGQLKADYLGKMFGVFLVVIGISQLLSFGKSTASKKNKKN